MLEEYVMTDDVSDDVGENLMLRDEDFEPPEVPFQPKPTSVSIIAAQEALQEELSSAGDFSGDSNFTTMPKVEAARGHPSAEHADPRQRPRPQPYGQAAAAGAARRHAATAPRGSPARARCYDEDLHSAPTMIIDISRMRGRGRG